MRRVAALAAAVLIGGCGASSPTSTTTTSTVTPTSTAPVAPVHLAGGFHLTSPAFRPGGPIPKQYTCDGADTPIPLRWSGVPKNARELVLVMRDPDSPSGNFVHWAVARIDPKANGPRGVPGRNSLGTSGYKGPCPPAGKSHHYVITLSALSGPSDLRAGFTADQLRTAAVGIATLVGTYARG